LQDYRSATTADKANFMAKLCAPGGKSLDWHKSWTQEKVTGDKVEEVSVEDWYTGNEILDLNKQVPKNEEHKDKLLKALIKESEERFSYSSATKEHPNLPELNRYFYVFSRGKSRAAFTQSTDTNSSWADTSKVKGLLDAEDPKPGVQIKMECPNKALLKSKLEILRSAKTVLEKLSSQGSDLATALSFNNKDGSLNEKVKEAEVAGQALDKFVSELRQFVLGSTASLEDLDESEAAKKLQIAEGMTARAVAFQDGAKALAKRLKPLIQ